MRTKPNHDLKHFLELLIVFVIVRKFIKGHFVFRPREWMNTDTFITLPSHPLHGMKTKLYNITKRTLESVPGLLPFEMEASITKHNIEVHFNVVVNKILS